MVLLPLLGARGLVGAIRCAQRRPYSAALHRDLLLASTLVAIRLAHLGAGRREIAGIRCIEGRPVDLTEAVAADEVVEQLNS